MIHTRHCLALILVLSVLASACGATDTNPRSTSSSTATVTASTPTIVSPTPTVFVETATPMPTPSLAPVLAWDVPPKSGVAHVDAIVRALTTGDANALASYVTGQTMNCYENYSPYCPPGTPPGGPVLALIHGACPGDTTPVTLLDTPQGASSPRRYETPSEWSGQIVGLGRIYLIGIYGPQRNSNPPRSYDPEPLYTITLGVGDRLARGGWVIGVDERGIIRNISARVDCFRPFGAGPVLVAPP